MPSPDSIRSGVANFLNERYAPFPVAALPVHSVLGSPSFEQQQQKKNRGGPCSRTQPPGPLLTQCRPPRLRQKGFKLLPTLGSSRRPPQGPGPSVPAPVRQGWSFFLRTTPAPVRITAHALGTLPTFLNPLPRLLLPGGTWAADQAAGEDQEQSHCTTAPGPPAPGPGTNCR